MESKIYEKNYWQDHQLDYCSIFVRFADVEFIGVL